MPSSILDSSVALSADAPPAPRSWPGGRSSSRSTWPAVLLSVATVAGLFSVLFLRNHRYFFLDDRIAEAVPKLTDIGRTVQSGQWPWLTTDIVNGGGHAVEYQHAVFNPLNLVMSVVLAQFTDVALGAFVYILVHAVLLTAAAAWLARLVGLSTAWSVAFAVSVGFGPYTVVWGAASWFQGLISFAWFVLAVAASFAFHLRPRRRYGWLVLFATFGCFTAGWPLAIPVLGLFAGALVLSRLLARAPFRATGWYVAWFSGGVLCSMVALYPLLTSFQFASRNSSITNASNFNVASLDGLVQFANPAYYGFFTNFGGYELQRLPHFYVAWFLLPILVFWKPRALPHPFLVLARTSAGMLLVSAVLALGPERLLVFRFPTRFLQYFGFFLLLVAAILVAHGCFVFTRRRLFVLMGLLGFLLLNTLQVDPQGVRRVAVFGVVVVLLCLLIWRQVATGVPAAVGTVVVLLGLAVAHPSGRGVDYGFPHDLSTLESLSIEDYTLFYGSYLPPDLAEAGGYGEYRPAATGLLTGDRQVNGYSSLGNRFFREHFFIEDQGNFFAGAAQEFTKIDPATGLSWLELLRVDQIIALLGPMNDEVAAALDESWQRVETRDITAVYRHPRYTLPGLVSYTSRGLATTAPADGTCELTALRECVVIGEATDEPGQVIFARLWFPGYRATLDGEPLEVGRHAGGLVTVTTPPGETGRLVLTYRSPGFYEFGLLALLGLAALAAASLRFRQGDA